MAQFNIDIVLRKLGEGGKLSADELKQVEEAMRKTREEADKGHSSHKKYSDLVKGLHTAEIPALTRAFHFLLNPMSLVTATLGVAIAAWREWAIRVREAALAAQELAHAQNSLSTPEIILAIAEANKKFAESEADIVKNANSAAVALNAETEAMLAQQRIAEKLADSELARQLEEIQSSDLDDAGKIQATERAQREARHRKEQAEVDAAEFAAQQEAKRLGIARGELGSARAALPSDAALQKQSELASHYSGQNKTLLPQLEADKANKIKELAKLWDERTSMASPDYFGTEPQDVRQKIRLPELDRAIDAKEKEIALVAKQIETSKNIETENTAKLAEMNELRTKLNGVIQEQTKIIEDSSRKLEALMEEWNRRRGAMPVISQNLDVAGGLKANREANAADARGIPAGAGGENPISEAAGVIQQRLNLRGYTQAQQDQIAPLPGDLKNEGGISAIVAAGARLKSENQGYAQVIERIINQLIEEVRASKARIDSGASKITRP